MDDDDPSQYILKENKGLFGRKEEKLREEYDACAIMLYGLFVITY